MSIKICWQFTADYRELEALKVFTQEPPRGHDRPLHSGCLTCSPAGYSRSRARLDSPFPLPQSPSGPVGQQTHPRPSGPSVGPGGKPCAVTRSIRHGRAGKGAHRLGTTSEDSTG